MTLTSLLDPGPAQPVDDVRRREFLGFLAAAGLVAACGAESTPEGEASAGYPRTVEHAGGELDLERRPARVVATGPFSELDVLLALGVEPAGLGAFEGDELRTWQRGADGVATYPVGDGPDIESLASLDPDLVVTNGTTYASYPDWMEQYERLCPVLALPDTMEEQLAVVAEALGLPEERLGEASEGIEAQVAGFAPARRPASIVIANYFGEGDVLIWTTNSPHAALMRRLGLPDLSSPPPPEDDPEAPYVYVSLEQVEALDADLLLVPEYAEGDPSVTTLEELPAFANLPVVREGRYVRQSVEEGFAVGDVTVLSLPVAIAAMERALA